MKHEEVLRALADGRRVEYNQPCRGWRYPKPDDYYELHPDAFEPDRWRLAPSPVAPGHLTWEEAKRLHDRGVKVQFKDPKYRSDNWDDVVHWFENALPDELAAHAYRRKPEPKRVPWTAEDVPEVCWVRFIGVIDPQQAALVVFTDRNGVGFMGGTCMGWEELAKCSYSTDRRNWKPCSKMEGE